MKQKIFVSIFFLFSFLFAGCVSFQSGNSVAHPTQETWQRTMEAHPDAWRKGADKWFLTGGDLSDTEAANHQVPLSSAMSTMMVRPSHFTKIKIAGDFKVQIFSGVDHNSVFISGPNQAVRKIAVSMRGNQLSLVQAQDAPSNMDRAIVRIGIVKLTSLTQKGCGTVEGIYIQPDPLDIKFSGSGHLYLSGHVHVRCITHKGSGMVSIFGVNTPRLKIDTSGSGSLHLCGIVGVQSITHEGEGNIDILGANSNQLDILTSGRGKIRINGNVNLHKLTAKEETCVYVQGVRSHSIVANLEDSARVGLAGITQDLYVNTTGTSLFWGRHLCSQNVYAKASDESHMNIAASHKAFATASDNSSIYFFGAPDRLSSFVSGYGVVMPMPDNRICFHDASYRPTYRLYKYSYKGEGEVGSKKPYIK